MLLVRGTRKFLDRVGVPPVDEVPATGLLGCWYANLLSWRPQAAIFVNEWTLLPVLVPLAPAKAVIDRFPARFAEVATRLGAGSERIAAEVEAMGEWTTAKTDSRSVLGTMTEFCHMADHYRSTEERVDLLDLSVWLAQTPCRVRDRNGIFPDQELLDVLR